jgi:hypothetical protein
MRSSNKSSYIIFDKVKLNRFLRGETNKFDIGIVIPTHTSIVFEIPYSRMSLSNHTMKV